MTIMYLADITTDNVVGVHDGTTAPTGTYDTGVAFTHAKQTFNGVSWDDIPLTWDELREKQREMIVIHQDSIEIHEREVSHDATLEVNYTMTPTKYQEWLQYFQDIRTNDEATHATTDLAVTALDALTQPV